MKFFSTVICVLLSILLNWHLTLGQGPPRLNIPGAVLVSQARPSPFRQARLHPGDGGPPLRLRRPLPSPSPAPIRPVVEETEEPPSSSSDNNDFDDEVSKLGISALQSAVRQAAAPEEEEQQRPVHFRPERPLPVLRQDIRDSPPPVQRPPPRQEQRENYPRPILRQEERENLPVRQPQPVRHSQQRQQAPPQSPPQSFRQPARGSQPIRQPSQYLEEDGKRHTGKSRKPTVQILRKFRNDNPDGSITWGYENEDGTFKEETLGIDCMTRGKYGYVDPDGVKREYSYETGSKCEEPEQEEELALQDKQPQFQPRKPQFRPQPPA